MALSIYDPEKLGAKCPACPFNSEVPVPPQVPKQRRNFTILLEGPGGVESVVGLPLTGKTGGWMSQVFDALHLERKDLAIRNAMACRPVPMASPKMFTDAIDCCRPRVLAEMESCTSGPPREQELILAMGNATVRSLCGKSGIHDWRGYPLEATDPSLKDTIIFPTFHPSFVMREPWYWPVLKLDFERALRFNDGVHKLTDFKWPPIYVDDNNDSVDALDRIYSYPEDVGVDVETGGKSPIKAPLLCVGVASARETVSVRFPFADRVEGLIRAILASKRHPKVLQNGNHDVISLGSNGVDISGNDYDLLPASRIAFPQIDHDLGFILSLFFLMPRYKSHYHAGKDKGDEAWLKAAKIPDRFREMKIYNAKDAWGTVKAKPKMIALLKGLPNGE